jgi:hypothetical protein
MPLLNQASGYSIHTYMYRMTNPVVVELLQDRRDENLNGDRRKERTPVRIQGAQYHVHTLAQLESRTLFLSKVPCPGRLSVRKAERGKVKST